MDYEGAAATKAIADKLEKQETKQSQEKAVHTMKLQLRQLEAKHQQEIEAAEQLTKRGLYHLQKERNSVVEPLEKALKKAEKSERIDKKSSPPDRRRRRSVSRVNSTAYFNGNSTMASNNTNSARVQQPANDDDFDDIDLATPRTFRKMYDMRATSGVRRLDLDGIDITKYLKPHQNNRSRPSTSISTQRRSNSVIRH